MMATFSMRASGARPRNDSCRSRSYTTEVLGTTKSLTAKTARLASQPTNRNGTLARRRLVPLAFMARSSWWRDSREATKALPRSRASGEALTKMNGRKFR